MAFIVKDRQCTELRKLRIKSFVFEGTISKVIESSSSGPKIGWNMHINPEYRHLRERVYEMQLL